VTAETAPLTYPFPIDPGLDLDERYAELRRTAPVVRVSLPYGGDAWLVTGYAETREVLANPRFSRAATTDPATPRCMPQPLPPGILQAMDPPDLVRLRRLVIKAFTMRQVDRLRPRIEQLVSDLLDGMVEHGAPADLVELFATPLPLTVICELLDVPEADRRDFRTYSEAAFSTTAFTGEETAAAMRGLQRCVADLLARRRQAPGDDLLSALIQARDDGDKLSEQELIMLGLVILIGGEETTGTQIANFVYTLLVEPERFAALRANPDLVPGAVEELLRYVPLGSSGGIPRVALEDVEIGGVTIRAGEAILTHTGAANRDGRAFPDADRLDLGRADNPHLAFGHGVHACLGAHLARMELQVALRALLRRFPELRLATQAAQIPWRSGLILRGPQTLLVQW
jgi:cytochrome P450